MCGGFCTPSYLQTQSSSAYTNALLTAKTTLYQLPSPHRYLSANRNIPLFSATCGTSIYSDEFTSPPAKHSRWYPPICLAHTLKTEYLWPTWLCISTIMNWSIYGLSVCLFFAWSLLKSALPTLFSVALAHYRKICGNSLSPDQAAGYVKSCE